MASVHPFLPTPNDFYTELQQRTDVAEDRRYKRFLAVLLFQRIVRGHLIRRHIAWLSFNAIIIQCAFRVHRARKFFRLALRRAVRNKHAKHYDQAARRIQKSKISMASVHLFLSTFQEFCAALQERTNIAEKRRYERYVAVLVLQRITRGHLVRKHIAWLSKNARIIQRAFRSYTARKSFRFALKQAVQDMHAKRYDQAANSIEALWRGHYSRRTKFCYRSYRRWLATVTERGERKAAEAAEFGIRSRADDLRILEEEARQWLAFVVFKLHHLLRTHVCAGVYSDPATTELSEFEKLLKSIHYLEYRKRLLRKYEEFVRKHRPRFSNKRLFPIIGNGEDYWYLSLPEMYELTSTAPKKVDTRHKDTHHGAQHKRPFLWKKYRAPSPEKGRGPFSPRSSITRTPPPPAPTPAAGGAGDFKQHTDPRFHLYVKHYTPQPALFDYVDFHINVLLARKCSIENIDKEE